MDLLLHGGRPLLPAVYNGVIGVRWFYSCTGISVDPIHIFGGLRRPWRHFLLAGYLLQKSEVLGQWPHYCVDEPGGRRSLPGFVGG